MNDDIEETEQEMIEVHEEGHEAASKLASVWRHARYDVAHEKKPVTRALKERWPELYLALERHQQEWPGELGD
jgi:hypothetical protein